MKTQQLHALFLRHPKVATDTRKLSKNGLFFALKGPNFDGNDFVGQALENGAAFTITDRQDLEGNPQTIVVENSLKALQDLANYHRHAMQAKIISLTGSNGKTTTKELIHQVLSKKYRTIATRGNLNNHIGVPLTLLEIKEDTELAVVEMGANHQKEIEFLCNIAAPDFGYITNFGKAHLEGFGGVAGVIKGKSELYDFLKSHQKKIFLNADDPIQVEKLHDHIEKYGFSQRNPAYYKILLKKTTPFLELEVAGETIETQLMGAYNFSNCCAAITMGKYFNVPLADIRDAITAYVPSNNRSQLIAKNKRTIILDAYNANPSSMAAALEDFARNEAQNKVLILGDMFEMGEYAETEHQHIVDLAQKLKFENVILVGDNFKKTKSTYRTFEDYKALEKSFKESQMPEKATILIKGSRGMALERIVEIL